MTDFSVLLPVYHGDQLAFFERALRSVGNDQSLPPTEIVVVCDGPVKPEVDALLAHCQSGQRPDLLGTSSLKVHRLSKNQGLSAALNAGLDVCECDIVARADADDIATPDRFACQIPLMDSYDLVGAAIAEFTDDENETGMVRCMPHTQEQIRHTVTYRSPFNHPTVVYRKDAVLAVGGYEHVHCMEDYLLFARMVKAGVTCCNVPDVLVKYRVGAGAYARRGGLRMLGSEIAIQRRFLAEKIVSVPQFVRNVTIRGGYRLIPTHMRQRIYRSVGKASWFKNNEV